MATHTLLLPHPTTTLSCYEKRIKTNANSLVGAMLQPSHCRSPVLRGAVVGVTAFIATARLRCRLGHCIMIYQTQPALN